MHACSQVALWLLTSSRQLDDVQSRAGAPKADSREWRHVLGARHACDRLRVVTQLFVRAAHCTMLYLRSQAMLTWLRISSCPDEAATGP